MFLKSISIKIILILSYAIFSVLWMFLSNTLLSSYAKDLGTLNSYHYYTDILYVFITIVFLFILLKTVFFKNRIDYAFIEKSHQLDFLTKSLPGMVYRCRNDENWTMEYLSENCFELTGYLPSELINNKLLSYDSLIHPNDREKVRKSFEESEKNRQLVQVEYRIIQSNGEEKWVFEVGGFVYDNENNIEFLEGVILDNSARKQAIERDLMLSLVFQVIPDLLFIMEKDGTIIDYRAQTNNDLYVPSEVFLNKRMQDVLPKEVGMIFKKQIQDISNDGSLSLFEYELEVEDKVRVFEARMAMLPEGQNILTIVRDITELRKNQKMLLLQSRHAALGEMLRNLAHQWRQPLSSISTAATGAKIQKEMDCLSDEAFYSEMDVINESAQYLSQTIEDFRAFFNPSNIKSKKFNIADTVNRTISIVDAQFKVKKIEIIEDIESYELISIENELIQVLMNILSNAKDILVDINDSRRLIFINTYSENDNITIEIIDNGGGIKEDIVTKVFEPYFTTKYKSQGTGIGLYMSQEVVENHLHGKLNVENTIFSYEGIDYKGAKFTIIIPLE